MFHPLVNYPPKITVSSLVNSLKGVSGRVIKKKNYPSIRSKLWGGALWSPSCFADSCGGATIAVIRQYIEPQRKGQPDRRDGCAVRALAPALKDGVCRARDQCRVDSMSIAPLPSYM